MTEIIAYCGLVCHTCPIYLATRLKNKAEQARFRAEIALLYKKQYGLNYSADDITDCDGCLTGGERLFAACRNCAIRRCAQERKLESCARCPEYACDKLEAHFSMDPCARTRLDVIRDRTLWMGGKA